MKEEELRGEALRECDNAHTKTEGAQMLRAVVVRLIDVSPTLENVLSIAVKVEYCGKNVDPPSSVSALAPDQNTPSERVMQSQYGLLDVVRHFRWHQCQRMGGFF